MWLYLIIFAIPLYAFIYGRGKYDHSGSFLKYYMFGLAFFVGLGDMLGGYDRYIYGEIFDSVADDLYAGVDLSSSYAFAYYEPGYMILNWLIAFITGNRYIFIFLITLIIYTNFYIAFKRHADNYPLTFLAFLGLLFFFSFTYLRQILGCSFALLSIKYLFERKFVHHTDSSVRFYAFANLMYDVYGDNAIISICFIIVCLFRDIIIRHRREFPSLFLFGPKGTGKTAFGELLQSPFVYCGDHPNLRTSTMPSLAIVLSQAENAMMHR